MCIEGMREIIVSTYNCMYWIKCPFPITIEPLCQPRRPVTGGLNGRGVTGVTRVIAEHCTVP